MASTKAAWRLLNAQAMTWISVASLGLALGLAACTDPIEIDFDPGGSGVVVYDDGTTLRIAGCHDREFLGCGPVAYVDTMTVTADGVTYDVKSPGDGKWIEDQALGLFRDGTFEISIPRPADGAITVALAGIEADIPLPESFAVSAPTGPIARSAGALEIGYDGLPDETQVLMISTCGTRSWTEFVMEPEPGAITLAFENMVGDCSHEIHVDQTTSPDLPGLAVDTVRIEKLVVTSTP